MSAIAIFEVNTRESHKIILEKIKNIWHFRNLYTAEVVPHPETQSVVCYLEYIWGEPMERAMIKDVINYLFSVSVDKKILYYRASNAVGDSVEYPRDILIDEIFLNEFYPGEYNGLQYRYLIKPTENQKEEKI